MRPDFVIVGAGAYGCAVAYHLARTGHSVTVLEARSIAGGASGGPGRRGVRANRRDLRELPLMREAYELWPCLADELGGETGYRRTGSIALIEDEVVGSSGGLVAADARQRTQLEFGIPTELWGPERIRETIPSIAPTVKAGLFAPKDGVASQEATTHAYANAAKSHGATFVEGAEVVGLTARTGTDGPSVTTASHARHTARHGVLLACNTGVKELLAQNFGHSLPTWTVYPQAMLLASENLLELPLLLSHDRRKISVKTLEDDVIMLSGGWRGRWNAETGAPEATQAAIDGNIAELRTVLTDLGELTPLAVHVSSPECATIDQIPFIGVVPSADGFFVATGWTGHGWALVPSASAAIAHMLTDRNVPAVLQPFSVTRAQGAGRHA